MTSFLIFLGVVLSLVAGVLSILHKTAKNEASILMHARFAKKLNEAGMDTLLEFMDRVSKTTQSDWKKENNRWVYVPFRQTMVVYRDTLLLEVLEGADALPVLTLRGKKIDRGERYRPYYDVEITTHFFLEEKERVQLKKIFCLCHDFLSSEDEKNEEAHPEVVIEEWIGFLAPNNYTKPRNRGIEQATSRLPVSKKPEFFIPSTRLNEVVHMHEPNSFENDFKEALDKILLLTNQLEKDHMWLSPESSHIIQETFPNDLHALREVYHNVQDKERAKRTVNNALHTITLKLLGFADEAENNKQKELEKREYIIEKR